MYICDHALATALVYDGSTEELTGLTATVFQYDLPNGTAEFNQEIQASRENGTVFYEQTLEINLFALTKEDRKEIQVMARMNLMVFVEDYNGNIFMMGRDGGADVNGGSVKSGKALGDMAGYTLTFQADEKDQAVFLEPYTTTPFDNLGFTVTVDPG
jgi:hypothetical protein